MANFIDRTFRGLTKEYYIRQLFFGALFGLLMGWMLWNAKNPDFYAFIALFIINTFLYPYSRFVYDSLVRLIIGDNVFVGTGIIAIIMLTWKLLTIGICFMFAIFIAPLGLLLLYMMNK